MRKGMLIPLVVSQMRLVANERIARRSERFPELLRTPGRSVTARWPHDAPSEAAAKATMGNMRRSRVVSMML